MARGLQVIGAGLPRTGTYSLRVGLERLLGGTCYHMSTLRERDGKDIPAFAAASRGEPVDWTSVFSGCTAAVDWPPSALWRTIAATYPDALIVLSERESPAAWWRSADATVWEAMRRMAAAPQDADRAWLEMQLAFMHVTFGPDWDDPAAAMAGYQRWNDEVRSSVPAERLVEWTPSMGWQPLCDALQLPAPREPFPHANTTAEFIRRRS